jgi:hypothetical protein
VLKHGLVVCGKCNEFGCVTALMFVAYQAALRRGLAVVSIALTEPLAASFMLRHCAV